MDQRPTDEQRPDSRFPRLSGDAGEYDALADLFLGDPDLGPRPATATGQRHPAPPPEGGPAPRPSPEPDRPRVVEAVLLGHLPVRASIWVRQYASAVGSSLGRPVGLLRVGPEAASVELVGPGAERLAISGEEPAGDLEEALRGVAGLADRWIVRVDEAAESGLAQTAGVDEVTILTGADEAAVVASYRLLKSLAASWDRAFGAEGGPLLGLAIMGSSGEQALAAGEKLERAAAAFLNRPVRVTARVPKIGVSAAATVYRGPEAQDVEGLIGVIRSEPTAALRLAEPEAMEPGADWAAAELGLGTGPGEGLEAESGQEPAGLVESDAFEQIEFEESGDDSAIEVMQTEQAVIEGDDTAQPESEREMPEPLPMVVTRPVEAVVPKRIERVEPGVHAARSGDEGVLEASESDASPAGLIGLRALETRCPYAGRVELAVDAEGWLHLVAEEGRDGREAVSQLLAAQSWARAHLALLLRAEPELAQPTSDRPHEAMLHLLTREASVARPLLDAEVRLHLVVKVRLGGKTGWVASELN